MPKNNIGSQRTSSTHFHIPCSIDLCRIHIIFQLRRFPCLTWIILLLCLLCATISSCAIGADDPLESLFTSGKPLFVAVSSVNGTVIVSKDGKAWAKIAELTGLVQCVKYYNNTLYAFGNNNEYYTNNLVSWNSVPVGVDRYDMISVNNLYISVGANQYISHSFDGINWIVDYSVGSADYLFGIAYGNGVFVAGGLGSIGPDPVGYYSFDGIHWTPNSSWVFPMFISKILFAQGRFTAVGNDGLGTAVIMTSYDGINWSNNLNPPGPPGFESVAYGRNVYVTVGVNGWAAYSQDGIFWYNYQIDPGNTIHALAFGNGCFVACCAGGRIFYSEDGITWALVLSNPAFGNFSAITYTSNFNMQE